MESSFFTLNNLQKIFVRPIVWYPSLVAHITITYKGMWMCISIIQQQVAMHAKKVKFLFLENESYNIWVFIQGQ